MSRYTIVYTNDGRSFVKGSPEHLEYVGEAMGTPRVFGDEGEFVSPIDGKVYSGKTGMREHNARHDVTNNRDLVGLRVGFPGQSEPTAQQRREIRQTIIETAQRKGYFHGQ